MWWHSFAYSVSPLFVIAWISRLKSHRGPFSFITFFVLPFSFPIRAKRKSLQNQTRFTFAFKSALAPSFLPFFMFMFLVLFPSLTPSFHLFFTSPLQLVFLFSMKRSICLPLIDSLRLLPRNSEGPNNYTINSCDILIVVFFLD